LIKPPREARIVEKQRQAGEDTRTRERLRDQLLQRRDTPDLER
jgi:hypothetical protein